MANTSKFNRDDVLQKASDLFWGKGFAGTSIRDIQDAVNMRPGSIYATFGSKEGLFKESLLSYAKSMEHKMDECIGNASNPIEGLKHFVECIIIEGASQNPSGICMMFKSSGEFNGQNPALFEFSQTLLDEFENKVTHIFAHAKHAGFVPEAFDEANAGQQFVIQFTGLRNYFNGRNQPELAKQLIDKMFKTLVSTTH